jgi:signal transduction histidine kinase
VRVRRIREAIRNVPDARSARPARTSPPGTRRIWSPRGRRRCAAARYVRSVTFPGAGRTADALRTIALLVVVTAPTAMDLLWVARSPESVVPMTIMVAVVSVPLIWRSRAPAPVFWTVTVCTSAGLVALSVAGLSSSVFTVVPMAAAAYQLALHGRPWSTLRFAITLVTVVGLNLVVLYRIAPAPYRSYEGALFAVFLVLSTWSVGLVTRQRLDAADQRAHLESERSRNAARDERERMARELHDGLAHHLTALVLRAEAARARQARASGAGVAAPADLTADLTAIAADGRHAVRETGAILDMLRGNRAAPGVAQLPDLVAAARSTGRDVRFRRTGPPPPAAVGATSYRVIQEALTNACRHGADGKVDVDVRHESGGTTIIVTNPVGLTATGFSSGRPGLGIIGIRERVAELGGEVRVARTTGRFTLRAWMPGVTP